MAMGGWVPTIEDKIQGLEEYARDQRKTLNELIHKV